MESMMKYTPLILSLVALPAMADPPPGPELDTYYLVLADIDGNGTPDRVLIDPEHDLGNSLDVGHIQVEINDEMGLTIYDLYGEAGDMLGADWHYVVEYPTHDKVVLSVAVPNCFAYITWDGEWDTLPVDLIYVGPGC